MRNDTCASVGRFVAKLFLLFTLVPLAELFLLVRIGTYAGFWPTVALVVATGFVGAWLARSELRRVMRGWADSLARGQVPEQGLLDGLLVVVAGVLLVTPGVLTDAFAILLLVPFTRARIRRRIRAWVERRITDGSIRVAVGGFPRRPPESPGTYQGRVVDSETEDRASDGPGESLPPRDR